MQKDVQAYQLIRQERLRRLRYEIYRKNPFEWLKDHFGEDEISYRWSLHPEYEGHKWDGDADPLYQAWMEVAKGNWVAIQAATGTGKTYQLARMVLWFLDVFNNSLVVTTATTGAQLEKNLWAEISNEMEKFKKVRPYTKFNYMDIKPEGFNNSPKCSTSKSHQAIGFVTNAGSDEQSATKAQGFHRPDMLIICDEAAGIRASVLTAFKNTSGGGHNIIVCVGNPDNEYDQLNQFAALKRVSAFRVSALDHPNVVLKREHVGGAVTQGSIDFRREEYGEDSPLYLSRVRGITPNESENSLIKRAWVDQCTVGHQEFCAIPSDSHNAVGVDVSNSQTGDKACLAWGKGGTLVSVQEFQCPNATHLAWNMYYTDQQLEDMDAKRKAEGYSDQQKVHIFDTHKLKDYNIQEFAIGIDSVGVGVSTVNGFLDLGITPTSLSGNEWGHLEGEEIIPKDNDGKLLYRFISLRTQMYWELREDIRNKRVVFDLTPEIMRLVKAELCVAKYSLTAGAIQVEKKDMIKKRLGGKSPNIADAIAYWNWVRKGYRANLYGWMPISAGE